MIKLQPKIYDHIMLTVRISFIPSVCSQVPVIVICLPEPRALSVETSTNNRRFLMVFPLLTAALSTPPDIWCQIVALFLISLIIELAISVASIVQVREEGWTSGMRENLEQHFPSLAFIEKKNLGDEILKPLPQAKIFFKQAREVEIIPF